MRARIIFRGLTLFEFSKGTEGQRRVRIVGS